MEASLIRKVAHMGKEKAAEALEINYDELADYLHCYRSVYMKVDGNVNTMTFFEGIGVHRTQQA